MGNELTNEECGLMNETVNVSRRFIWDFSNDK